MKASTLPLHRSEDSLSSGMVACYVSGMEWIEYAVKPLLAVVAFYLLWAIPELLKKQPWKRRDRRGPE